MSAPTLFVPAHNVAGRRRVLPSQLLRVFVILCCVGLVLVAPPVALGARMELLLAPVLAQQVIAPETVVWSGDRLCWTWVRNKLRAPEVVNVDVVLVTADGDRSYPEVFDEISGMPWHRGGALPAGHHENRFCVQQPKFLGQHDRFDIRQTVFYAGFLGLWSLRVALPDVASPR